MGYHSVHFDSKSLEVGPVNKRDHFPQKKTSTLPKFKSNERAFLDKLKLSNRIIGTRAIVVNVGQRIQLE